MRRARLCITANALPLTPITASINVSRHLAGGGMFGFITEYWRTRSYYKATAELYQQEYLDLAEEYVRFLKKQAQSPEADD
jgi:hypothetical protein